MNVRLIPLLQELCNQITCLFSVLSAFEESSAACASDTPRLVSKGQYLGVIRMPHAYGGIVHPARGSAFCDDQ